MHLGPRPGGVRGRDLRDRYGQLARSRSPCSMRRLHPIPMRLFVFSALVCAAFCGCTTPPRTVPHASPKEAATIEFPHMDLPREGRQRLDGNMAASIQLAMDDFLPWDAPPPEPSPIHEEPCLRRRESYDVTAVPLPESVILVRFDLNTAACKSSDPLILITTYAIDVRTMRLLSREIRTRPNPSFSPSTEAPPPAPDARHPSPSSTDSH
jgi:hypothetical protein